MSESYNCFNWYHGLYCLKDQFSLRFLHKILRNLILQWPPFSFCVFLSFRKTDSNHTFTSNRKKYRKYLRYVLFTVPYFAKIHFISSSTLFFVTFFPYWKKVRSLNTITFVLLFHFILLLWWFCYSKKRNRFNITRIFC